MFEIRGNYCKNCIVYADTIEDEAISTIQEICDNPAFKDSKIRIMPDCHQGKGIVIGFTCPMGNYVNPSHVGVDIGCSMTSIRLSKPLEEKKYPTFERKLRNNIPTGFNIQPRKVFEDKDFYKFLNKEYQKARSSCPEMIKEIDPINENSITKLCQRIGMDEGIFYKSLGSIGGGNHFLEYGISDSGEAWFTIHCGSRNFGVKVANYWISQGKKPDIDEIRKEIEKIKETVSDKTLLEGLIKEAKSKMIPSGYLTGENLKGYLSDMVIAQAYAKFNHFVISDLVLEILKGFGISEKERIFTTHNYISFEDRIIRKGAIQSYSGRKMIIPFNMRDGLAICEGKSNEEWNFSAPHGAGRIMSRTAARKNIDVEEFKKSMEGIYSTSVGPGTIDESPMVYKNTEEIIKLISPTANILFFVRPRINIKSKDTMED